MGRPAIDLVGQVYGRLTVLSRAEKLPGSGRARWLCGCECGMEKIIGGDSLRNGHTKSCGCLQKERVREANTTHGRYQDTAYHAWENMKQRCLNPKHPNWKHYGGRGITIHQPWIDSFEVFYRDVGGPPAGLSIDRVWNDGPYHKFNVRWATQSQQLRNRRSWKKGG